MSIYLLCFGAVRRPMDRAGKIAERRCYNTTLYSRCLRNRELCTYKIYANNGGAGEKNKKCFLLLFSELDRNFRRYLTKFMEPWTI